MRDFIKNIFRFVVFIFIQVHILNKIPHIHHYVVPSVYYLFLLWLPFSIDKSLLLFAGFFTGLTLDFFMHTPGLHAAPCVLIAYLRPFIIFLLSPKDQASQIGYREPSPIAFTWPPYLMYTFVLTVFHHGTLFFLEMLSIGSFFDFIIKLVLATAISMLLIIITEMLFQRKMKFKTNTA